MARLSMDEYYAKYAKSPEEKAAQAQSTLEWNLGANWQDIYDYDAATNKGGFKDGYSWQNATAGRFGAINEFGDDVVGSPNSNSPNYYGNTSTYMGGGSYGSNSAGGYRSPYADQIDALLSQIQSQKNFSYNVEDDPLYQQYKEQYQLQGARAMQDTLGAVAGNTGGMVSSWATTAAQQAADYHGAQLNAMVPQLHNQAYNQYLDAQESELRRLSTLQGFDNTEYGRYRDTINDQRAQAELAYQRERDALLDSRYDQQWDYNVGRDAIADQRYEAKAVESLNKGKGSKDSSDTAYRKALAALNSIPTTSGKSEWWYDNDASLRQALTDEEYWRLMQVGFRDVSTEGTW